MRLAFEECLFDSDTREVVRADAVVPVSPKAFALLELLVRRRPKAVSKAEIHEYVWPGTFVSAANLANLVAELRAGLGDDARAPRILRTVPRFGYAFSADAVDVSDTVASPPTGAFACRLEWGHREIALDPGENLIGRDPGCAVLIDDTEVSRRHARILVDGSGAILQDLGSKNGTLWNGRKIEASRALANGDRIGVGSATLVVRALRHAESTKTAAGSKRGKPSRA